MDNYNGLRAFLYSITQTKLGYFPEENPALL